MTDLANLRDGRIAVASRRATSAINVGSFVILRDVSEPETRVVAQVVSIDDAGIATFETLAAGGYAGVRTDRAGQHTHFAEIQLAQSSQVEPTIRSASLSDHLTTV